MNSIRHYIRTLLLMLLLTAGGINEAWADKTVTYHVITLPFGSAELTEGSTYRIEAIKKTVTCADDATIELPSELKSPLLTDDAYSYYCEQTESKIKSASATAIFPNNPLVFYTYSNFIPDNKLASGAKVSALGALTDIYVIYDWAGHKSAYGNWYKLDGSETYNIEFVYKDKGAEKHEFFAMNMNEPRGNRAQAIPFEDIPAPSDLCTDGPHTLKDGQFDAGQTAFHYTWLLLNNDPYNIILETAYAKDAAGWGDFTYTENGYSKKSKRARFYGRVNSSTAVEANSWMNNEWGYTWPAANGGTPTAVPGWFRGNNKNGIGTNGVQDRGLYFSFALLKRTAAENDFTLVALCANTNASSWVPNASGNYLHLGRQVDKYPGPYYTTFANADRVILHDIRTYHFKVKTPFYNDELGPTEGDNPNHVLSYDLLLSEHYEPENILDFVPDALKRKYVKFEGAYKEPGMTNALTTFANVEDANNGRVIWLKYSTNLPFETATASTTFDKLKWYTIHENKEEDSYITWYDAAHNWFNTKSNPSKFNHHSHFAFVGDPYELYIINRQASESDKNNYLRYLKFASTATDPMVISTYKAVANGTTLTAGKKYYTSSAGEGEFVAVGSEGADGTNYFELEGGDPWEIIYDNNTGDYLNCFRLRQFNSYSLSESDPKYIGWMYGDGTYTDYPLNGNTEAVRLSVRELPVMDYTYYIVDNSGRIAVKAKVEQQTGITLGYETIPEVIRSPFLQGASLEFYTYDSQADLEGQTANHHTNRIYTTNSVEADEYKNHIFVYYPSSLPDYTELIDGDEYNLILNNNYIYHDDNTIKNKENIDDFVNNNNYLWILNGSDPYAITIQNKGNEKYVEVPDANSDGNPDWNPGMLGWANSAPASKYIIKSAGEAGGYEVMAATGIGVDATATYYNIGRIDNDVKLFSNKGTPAIDHGHGEIRFQFKKSSARRIIYHLIDKSKVDLIQEAGRQAIEEKPQIPAEIFSPLVEKYTYWKSDPRAVSYNEAYQYGDNERFQDVDEFTDLYWNNASNTIDVWITYTTSKKVDLNHTTMYLLKFAQGVPFKQENGSDGMLTDEELADENISKPVYPYCNGDCNFNVYGQYQYELQQEGAASTRTRWAWYLESGNDDPYHVRILSRQTETYQGLERSAYFATRVFTGYDEVVTSLVWPNISGVQSTEYMVLGNTNQYQLVTTYPIQVDKNGDGDYLDEGEDERYVVDSFEQYWKTYDTVKKKLLSDLLSTCAGKDQGDNPSGSFDVPTEPASLRTRLTGTGEGQYGLHSYSKMAYAKRWNGYNKDGEKKKGWESREHWFQTVDMGSGYFDLIPITIDPALILLDQHGWEIMRKPMPSDPNETEAERNRKLSALRSYDSPMVKEYIFWASAKKRSGYHQYYLMDKRIGGSDFTSTSLASYPTGNLENVKDNKGNLYDQYVTYIVKEEYALSYNPDGQTADPFLIRQGDKIAYNNGNMETIGKKNLTEAPYSYTMPEGVSQYIISNISTMNDELWFVKPNVDIDREMGYPAVHPDWKDNPNAYEDAAYQNNHVASIIEGASDDDTVKKYGRFSFSNGFDPYNIQISSKTATNKYFTLPMTSANVSEGVMVGSYSGEPAVMDVKLKDKNTTPVVGNGYDNSKWQMTNQTLIAVQDENGNMQLMPRFDHNMRVRDFGVLVTPTEEAADANKLKETYTQLYRPYVYNYRIIDNTGKEALRYQSGGELLPQMPDLFKSPLAKDFKYYHDLAGTAGVYSLSGIDSKEITASMVGAGLSTKSVTTSNFVYVRYAYDADADKQDVLLGKWLSMKLDDKDAIYSDGIKEGDSKPSPVVGKTNRDWQWKFLKNPYTDPDPYAVKVFNRLAANKDKPLSVATASLAGGTVSAIEDGTDGYYQRFALLGHSDTDGDGKADTYALAVAGTRQYTYYYLNGDGMNTTTAAVSNDVKNEVKLFNDVTDNYTYKVYTNGGVQAITAEQTFQDALDLDNNFAPTLPEAARSPLLNIDQYRYYEYEADMNDDSKILNNLYGLYDGDVYVRYTYEAGKSEYKVPNKRNDTSAAQVARSEDSNDSPLKFGPKMLYNFYWHDDNIMKSNSGNTGVESETDQDLQSVAAYEWQFLGDDPYAIQIKNKGAGKFIDASNGLSSTPQTFMLLSKEGYDYGVLATTGDKDAMLSLSLDGSALSTTTTPNKFIIFSLSTNKVIYHLVIANIGNSQTIPYRKGDRATADGFSWNDSENGYSEDYDADKDKIDIAGTTNRDLTTAQSGLAGDKYQLGATVSYPNLAGTLVSTTYCKDFGPVSLGDALTVPKEFYRPNVVYTFVIQDIRNKEGDASIAELNNKYKGMVISSKEMGLDDNLVGKTIYINIVYSFDGDLDSNSGDNFVLNLSENKWYTLETQVGTSPYLAQYTNAWGFELKEGRDSHYTNDFLWSPIGDPYGFRLFNRYMDVNSGDDNLGEKNRVIFSRHFLNDEDTDEVGGDEDIHDGGQQILMGQYLESNGKLVVVGKPGGPIASYPYTKVAENSVYELLEPTDPEDESLQGYFRFHPVVNTKEQTQVYFNPVWADDDDDDNDNFLVRLSPTAANFTFGLSKELLQPYFDRAGYVGGLKKSVYEKSENAALVAAMKAGGEPTVAQLREAQTLVYNFANTVPFTTGYYRLHSPLGISNVDPVRYVSGYTHKSELTGGEGNTPIPMHFYEKDKDEVRTFVDLINGFTSSVATRGDLSILPVERDPASIFHFTKIYDQDRYNLSFMSTQGLYVRGTVAKGVEEGGSAYRAKAVMTTNSPSAGPWAADADEIYNPDVANPLPLFVMDLGGGVLLIHDQKTEGGRALLKYLSFDNSNDTEGNPTVYDMKMTHYTHTDHAKFCLQPVQSTATKGVNEMPLKVNLNNGGDGYYYASFCAPFDVLLTDATNDAAYICKIWDKEILHLKKLGKYNTDANGCPVAYKGNNQFVPAGTPVIIRSKKTSITMALPTTEPSTALANNYKKSQAEGGVGNIFVGTYLEQLLADETGSNDVYTFGLPISGTATKHADYSVASDPNNGEITIEYPKAEENGVGFFINANPNRETGSTIGEWIRNNRYVYGNRIYYRVGVSAGLVPAPQKSPAPEFIPVVFDDDDDEDEPIADSIKQATVSAGVYDLSGRCVVTEEEVRAGGWYSSLRPGIYILNGKKFKK